MRMSLDAIAARQLFELIEPNLHRAYPYKPQRVLRGDGDAAPPRLHTPIFFGCFDWHSAVHGHWSIARLRRLGGDAEWVPRATALLDRSFRPEAVTTERDNLAADAGFEMPYGIAWLLALCAELGACDERAHGWRRILAPLEELAADRFATWLERLPCPIRDGQHSQSAFAMGLALDWARASSEAEMAALIEERAREFYAQDAGGPLAYEPSAYDFLSPCLGEADLMARVLDATHFGRWLGRFLPSLDEHAFEPVRAADRDDGKLAHFDGLNFSRAWMLGRIAAHLPPADPRRGPLRRAANAHGAAGMACLDRLTYAGSHWVGTFALYWLTC